jgi:hypothetical protein
MLKKIETICAGFKPITLKEMDSVMFMDRIESKYSFHKNILPLVLQKIQNDYRILEIDHLRIFPYSTLYFDTENNSLFQGHHGGKFFRYKIRCRKYVSCNLSFFEIKEKTTGDRTIKNRIQIDDIETNLSDKTRNYLKEYTPYNSDHFEPKIYTDFSRITLVSNTYRERATIDLNLHFKFNGHDHSFNNLVIVEVKKNTTSNASSKLIHTLRNYRIASDGISKYCIGRALIEKGLKSNNFREDIRNINKIDDGKYYYLNFDKH